MRIFGDFKFVQTNLDTDFSIENSKLLFKSMLKLIDEANPRSIFFSGIFITSFNFMLECRKSSSDRMSIINVKIGVPAFSTILWKSSLEEMQFFFSVGVPSRPA